ncbi:MAG: PQQ-binding-like beta-propeller repeat protein, partial [Saezia sp.]
PPKKSDRVEWASRDIPPELLCEMPKRWVSDKINLPMARIPMLVEGDVIFTGSEKVSAIDRHTGKVIWSYYTGDINFDTILNSDGVQALAVDEKQVYFGGSLKTIYALDKKTGELRWSFKTPGYILEKLAQDDERVYAVSNRQLYALNKVDGSLMWQSDFDSPISAPVFENDKVYLTGSYAAYALDSKTGAIVWKEELDTKAHIDSSYTSPSIYDGQLMFSEFSGNVFSLDLETGEVLWTFSSTALRSALRVTNGHDQRVLLNNTVNTVVLFDLQTQTPLWWFAPYAGKNYMYPTIYKDIVLIGTEEYYLSALDLETGEEVFRMPITPEIEGIRVIEVRDGVMYFSSPRGRIMAYELSCPQLKGRW